MASDLSNPAKLNVRMRSKLPSGPGAKIGQCLIIGFSGHEMSTRLSSLLSRVQPAGVILFARNIKSAEQTWRLLQDCQKCLATPLFTCVDVEGGTVDRFRDVLGPSPSAADVFATGDRKLFRRHGEILGRNCSTLGFNVDFAPVLDLAFERSRKVLGKRAVSADPRKATIYAREFLKGLGKAHVLGCGKHFPGLGEAGLDSHFRLPVIDKPMKTLWNEDLSAYRSLRHDLRFVMVAHASYPHVTRDRNPASLSKLWITNMLRKRIGYRGLIVSDDLEMGGVLGSASVGEAAVRTVRAGSDLCLICHREDHVLEAYDALVRAAERDRKFARRVEEAAGRVLALKKRSAKSLRMGKMPSARDVAKLTRHLWEFSEQVRIETLNRAEQPASSRETTR